MKNIYLCCLAFMAMQPGVKAQLTLTKANNQPVSGDTWQTSEYDSTTAVPRNTGSGQTWNFTSMSSKSQTSIITYTQASSAPGNSLFPNATLAELKSDGGETGFFDGGGSSWEFLGFYDVSGPTSLYLSNGAIMAAWPISYGSSNIDALSGVMTSGTSTVNWTGSLSVTASGSGSVIMPNGDQVNNCLMVVLDVSIATGSGSYLEKRYSFYTTGTKFPIVEFAYETNINGSNSSSSFNFESTLSQLPTGIYGLANPRNFVTYPNPALDFIKIVSEELVTKAELFDMSGRSLRKFVEAGNELNVQDLPTGLYYLEVQTASGSCVKKIIKE